MKKHSTNLDTSHKSEPALELISRALPSVEAHHCSDVLTQEEIPEEGGLKTPDWININFNNIHTTRQTRFMTSKANRLKVGMNQISNRFYYLNGKIELDWLNLSYDTYKVKCKKLFL